MPDISMCKGADHPHCGVCYRKLATPSPMQAYLSVPPMGADGCPEFVEMKSKSQQRRLDYLRSAKRGEK